MVDNIVSKPFWLVLIVTAHLVFNGPTQAEVIGILGDKITFEFTFNMSVTQNVGIYTIDTHQKIAQYTQGKTPSREGDFYVYPKDTSVFVHIINLKLNHNGIYSASLFTDTSVIKSNNKVQLIVREDNRSNTGLPVTNDNTNNEDGGRPSFFSSHIVTVLMVLPVVLPVVLLAAVLPLLIWCRLRTNGRK